MVRCINNNMPSRSDWGHHAHKNYLYRALNSTAAWELFMLLRYSWFLGATALCIVYWKASKTSCSLHSRKQHLKYFSPACLLTDSYAPPFQHIQMNVMDEDIIPKSSRVESYWCLWKMLSKVIHLMWPFITCRERCSEHVTTSLQTASSACRKSRSILTSQRVKCTLSIHSDFQICFAMFCSPLLIL